MIKKFLSNFYYKYFYYSPFGYRLRHYLHTNEVAGIKPFSKNVVISDLFVYRHDNEWDTSFQLFNMSSFLFPELKVHEKCEIHFFGTKGKFIKKIDFILNPFELKTIEFSRIDNLEEAGTFAIFHFSNILPRIHEKGSCLTERGYISYKYKNSPLYSYCHGNLQSLSKGLSSKIKTVAAVAKSDISYYPQMIFSECNAFELIFTNPTTKIKKIRIELINDQKQLLDTIETEVHPFGVELLKFQNQERRIHTIKSYGQIVMWRPLVKKFYDTHFDVLHG